MTFVLIHGSWHNGSAWDLVATRLRSAGAPVLAPSLRGMESRSRPAGRDVGLRAHVDDVADLLVGHDLSEVALVGHSYGGFVISGVAERVPERIGTLVYLDAFVPENGQCLAHLLSDQTLAWFRELLVDDRGRTRAQGAEDPWLMPPGSPADYGVSDPEQAAWLEPRLVFTPMRTFEEVVPLCPPAAASPRRAFVRCTGFGVMEAQERKAVSLGWPVERIPTGHDAMVTRPDEVASVLLRMANRT